MSDLAFPPLGCDDICDWHCTQRAALRIITLAGDLYACTKHYEENVLRLNEVAVYVQDDRLKVREPVVLEEPGRMNDRKGLRYIDQCRWCCSRLERRTICTKGTGWVATEFYICPTCDETADPNVRELLELLQRD